MDSDRQRAQKAARSQIAKETAEKQAKQQAEAQQTQMRAMIAKQKQFDQQLEKWVEGLLVGRVSREKLKQELKKQQLDTPKMFDLISDRVAQRIAGKRPFIIDQKGNVKSSPRANLTKYEKWFLKNAEKAQDRIKNFQKIVELKPYVRQTIKQYGEMENEKLLKVLEAQLPKEKSLQLELAIQEGGASSSYVNKMIEEVEKEFRN